MLKVGIIGFGRIGAEHADWIRRAGLEIAAVYDPTEARAQLAESRGFPLARTLESAFAAGDAILIATPTSQHLAHATAALDAGKHVMVEKPVALDLAGALALRTLARRRSRVLSVFQCRRWDADYLAVRRLLASGLLGQVFNIESRLGQFASCVGPAAREWRPGWRTEAAFGGGGLYDWGSHFVDQLVHLLPGDPVVRVFAQLKPVLWSKDCDDFARVLLDFRSGVSALCEINTVTSRPLPRWHLDGTTGSASSPPSAAFSTTEWAQFTITRADGQPATVPAASEAGLDEPAIWSAFARACADRSEPPVTIDSVIRSMRVMDAARVSSREGRAVQLGEV
jgi:predicted dehydrogenase